MRHIKFFLALCWLLIRLVVSVPALTLCVVHACCSVLLQSAESKDWYVRKQWNETEKGITAFRMYLRRPLLFWLIFSPWAFQREEVVDLWINGPPVKED